MLSKFKQFFFNPVCFRCGSFFVRRHLFCEICFEVEIAPRLELKEREIEFEGKKMKHYFLIEWIPGESDLISGLIYQLKKDRCLRALKFYSELLAKQVSLLNKSLEMYNCVLSLPGSTKSSVHSIIIAGQLAEIFMLPMRLVFRKMAEQNQQKKRRREDRKSVQIELQDMELHELITETKADKLNPIYVDDVLTTGSTLKASIKALGTSPHACVMTLFFRPNAKT